jgi:hypothetical protein
MVVGLIEPSLYLLLVAPLLDLRLLLLIFLMAFLYHIFGCSANHFSPKAGVF